MATLDEIRAAASPATFPLAAVREVTEPRPGLRSALCLYAAAFLGRQDVIHLHDLGIYVFAVDANEEKVEEMRGLYGKRLSGRFAEAFTQVADMIAAGAEFDVVTADPWTQDIPAVLDRLATLARLSTGLVIVGVTRAWMEGAGFAYSAEGLRLWTAARGIPLDVVTLHERSQHVGGVAWGVWRVQR